ncbi:FAD:protein FMN transferase [Virgibacillus pantothenticus]|uniref:FAD:protein FMN transferase n=2 Tax=Virgibacillus pantothenticus TaxID=1473 RepID=UPI0020B302C9|nr:FAD:protein FMN transferase [Virgibacillus pantothenticus]MEB5453128.1 FAD:protein FMN transferase [Virgibacillus pantothenticus]MEB5457427.1 FAD:protein FMN transferase [Virgibacillus pantothenticus]MEB5461348.1 FAD:protein FMN transferase [Virgibacillus pantothenticus]MEB5465746.1 FAD:protein FMN transferase [Virgibacillus pantothenticus]MEB5470045.1 FAD:protein FMN transferase [Virgibacillus pantothenticus]
MELKRRVVHLMGTVIDLSVQHELAEAILDKVIARLKEYEHRFSANDPSSELMQVNKNAGIQPVTVHPELYELIKIGKEHSCAEGSHLNIAIGPLVQTWRIGFSNARVPYNNEITELLERTNPKKIVLHDKECSVFLTEPGMLIDLGALAKGYIADLIIDFLKKAQVTSALINLGGNLVVLGPSLKPDGNWHIGIQDPLQSRDDYLAVLKIFNQSVVTSGVYERSLTQDGQTYHHIIDPQTGYPMTTDVVSLTIISDQSVDGEIWTTRLFGKTADEIIKIVNDLQGMECMVVSNKEEIFCSAALEAKIVKQAI